jgi:hypothetical protein
MGFLASVTAFERSSANGEQTPEVTVDHNDGATALHLSAPGDDAPPLDGDLAFCADDAGAGGAQAVAYQDPALVGVAGRGDKRIFARSGPGVVAVELWLKADGSLVAKNASGELSLAADGAARVGNAAGELAVDAAGNVTWTTAAGTNGAATHTHGSPFGPTTAPIPST